MARDESGVRSALARWSPWVWPVPLLVVTAVVGEALGRIGAVTVVAVGIAAAVVAVMELRYDGRKRVGSVVAAAFAAGAVFLVAALWLPTPMPISAVDSATTRSTQLDQPTVDGLQLRGVDLRGTRLDGLRLAGRSLDGVDASGASFRGGDLTGASLRGGRLAGADLRNSCLRGADLTGADLTGADATGADTTGVTVSADATASAAVWPQDPPSGVIPSCA